MSFISLNVNQTSNEQMQLAFRNPLCICIHLVFSIRKVHGLQNENKYFGPNYEKMPGLEDYEIFFPHARKKDIAIGRVRTCAGIAH